MNSSNVVRAVLRELEIDTSGLSDSALLRDDLGIDSTELVEIAVAIERSTALKISTEEVLAMKTLGDLVAYVDGAPQHG
jgi:acyl carrier protein